MPFTDKKPFESPSYTFARAGNESVRLDKMLLEAQRQLPIDMNPTPSKLRQQSTAVFHAQPESAENSAPHHHATPAAEWGDRPPVKAREITQGKTVLVRIRHNINCTYHSLHLGTIMFTGETEFSDGVCYGIELEKPEGFHNGRRQDGEHRHFICKKNHGVYVSLKQIIKVMGADGHRHWKHTILPKDRLPLTPSKPKDLKLKEGGPSMIQTVELELDRDDPCALLCKWFKLEEHRKATHLTIGQINRYQLQYRFVKPLKVIIFVKIIGLA
jgi:uncharacterized protein YodC (DUF2158 family)